MSKKYFEAIGRQYASRGIVFARIGAVARWPGIPQWAIDSVMRGNAYQAAVRYNKWVEQRKSELAAQSIKSKP